MSFKLEKYVDGEWCEWGTYESVDDVTKAAFELGRNAGCVENVRVLIVEGEPW